MDNRFANVAQEKSATKMLGPGQYYNPSEWIKELPKRSKSQLRDHSKMSSLLQHHQTPPSIPSGDFKFGYKVDDETHNMISLKLLFQQKLSNEDSEHYLGPGYYDVTDQLLKKRRAGAVSYAQDTSRRSKLEIPSQSKVVGPGTYEVASKSP